MTVTINIDGHVAPNRVIAQGRADDRIRTAGLGGHADAQLV